MNQKMKSVVAIYFGLLLLFGVALYASNSKKQQVVVSPQPILPSVDVSENIDTPVDPHPTITYLISEEDTTTFCDGATMDSIGYRRTITTEVTSDVPKFGLTESDIAKETAVLATKGMCREALRNTEFQVIDGVVEIAPMAGWAGMSIALCSCQPQVEVNLLRIPGITRVNWSSDRI